jgi:hypothetical protein
MRTFLEILRLSELSTSIMAETFPDFAIAFKAFAGAHFEVK